MKSSDLLRAIGDVDEKYVKSAKKLIKPKKEQNKFVSGALSALKFAGAAAVVLAVILAIWIPSRFFPHDPDAVQSGTAADTTADETGERSDTPEYNLFICGDQTVEALTGYFADRSEALRKGAPASYETDDLILYLNQGLPKDLVFEDDVPTLYYNKGDRIDFINDPATGFERFDLWFADGSRPFKDTSYANNSRTITDGILGTLDNHPGVYCLTAALHEFSPTGQEIRITAGVRIVSTVELPEIHKEGYNVFVIGDTVVEGKFFSTYKNYTDPETGELKNETAGVDVNTFLKDEDVPAVYYEYGDKFTFRVDGDTMEKQNYYLYDPDGEQVAGGTAMSEIVKYMKSNTGVYKLIVEIVTYGRVNRGGFEFTTDMYGIRAVSCGVPGSDPETDAGRVIALAQSLAEHGYNEETWQKLLSYGDTAFDTLVKRYFEGEKDIALRTVISNYASYLFEKEAENQDNEAFTAAFKGQKYLDLQSDFSNLSESEWLYKYRANAKSYAGAEEETVVAANTPNVYRLLVTGKFKSYSYYPERHGIPEMVEEYIRATLAKDTAKKTGIIANYLKSGAGNGRLYELIEYCVKRYRTEEDDNARALLCWIAYNILRYNSTVTDAAFREAHDYTEVNENNVTYKYVVEKLAPYIADYEKAAEEYAKTIQREYVEADAPVAYTILTAYGFDGYKPGKPDISFYAREAISALNELYQAANYGNIKYYTDLIGKLNFARKTYTVTKNGYTDSHDRYECDEEEFYAYFDKYLPSGMARSYVKTRAVDIGYIETEDVSADICLYEGKISFSGELFDQSPSSINAKSARLINQNGNKATLGVEFRYGHGMTSTPVELELEIVKDDNGIRITGGELIDKTMKRSSFAMTGMIIYNYMVMRECVFLEDMSIYGKVYSSYDELPNDIKKSVDPDARFPLILKERVIHGWEEEYMTKEIYDALFVDTTDVYDGKYLYPDKAPGRVEPAFFGSPKIKYRNGYEDTGSEVLAAMKIIKSDEHGVTLSLDFKVDGKVRAYTFEYTIENGRVTLTGGTFVTELILDK